MKKLTIILAVLLAAFTCSAQKHNITYEQYGTDVLQNNQLLCFSLAYAPCTGYPSGYSCQVDNTYARTGTKSARFEVRFGDSIVGGNNRAEVNYNRLSPWADTLDKWAISTYRESPYPYDKGGEGHIQYQVAAGQGSGGPPWELGHWFGKPYLFITYNATGTGTNTAFEIDLTKVGVKNPVRGTGPSGTVLVACPEVTDEWVDWAFYFKRSVGSDGIFRVWRNSVLVFERFGPNYNMYISGGVPTLATTGYIKYGIYKYTWNSNTKPSDVSERHLWHDDFMSGGPNTPMSAMFQSAQTPPTANAGTTQQLKLPSYQVNLSGSASDDGTFKVAWSKVSGPSVTIYDFDNLTTPVDLSTAGTYIFRLTVTDNHNLTTSDTVSVTLLAPNQVPVVNAGADKTIQLPVNSTSLTGSATDPDGTISSYLWTKVSGGAATIGSPTSAGTNITGLGAGTYVFQLRATDNEGGQGIDQVTILVKNANLPPTASAGVDRIITLPTNTITQTGSGTDPDGTVIDYYWQKVSGGNAVFADPNSATLSISGLEEGSYVFSLTVTDNQGLTNTDVFNLVVNPAPPPPNVNPTADAGDNASITLPVNSTSLDGTGSADSDGSIVSYSWSKISGPSTYSLSGSTSATATAGNLVQGTYVFQLVVTDNRGGTGVASVTVTVNAAVPPPNQAPSANAGLDAVMFLPTNSLALVGSGFDPDGTITGYLWTKLSGPSATLTNTTSATANAANLVKGTYIFQLRVTDNQGATGIDTKQVIVNSAPVNNPPAVSAGPDKTLRLPINFTTLTGTATDSDGTITSRQWTRVSGPNTPLMSGTTANSLILFNLIQGTYVFSFRATDDKGASTIDYAIVYVQKSRVTAFSTVYKLVNYE